MKVEGVNQAELRQLMEMISEQPENQTELEKTAEFSIPTWRVSCYANVCDNVEWFYRFSTVLSVLDIR